LFYQGATEATLDSLAARRPDGGLYAWATQRGEHDPGHDAPWGWRVSLYTWTKGLAVGGLLVPLILIVCPGPTTRAGGRPRSSRWRSSPSPEYC